MFSITEQPQRGALSRVGVHQIDWHFAKHFGFGREPVFEIMPVGKSARRKQLISAAGNSVLQVSCALQETLSRPANDCHFVMFYGVYSFFI
jgi:hypothetical protein